MTDITNLIEFTEKKLQKLLYIRQHLIKAGLINQCGEIITNRDYQSTSRQHSRRRLSSKKNFEKFQTPTHHDLSTINRNYLAENKKTSRHYRRSKSSNHSSLERRFRSANISRTGQRSRSQSPRRSIKRVSRAKSILDRRANSPQLIQYNKRCIITMVYYGSQTNIDYKRKLFHPEGDQIIVMQQHCGGENIIVYKDSLEPNQSFQFESRRQPNYPFALTLYVNGLIDSRLSVCCEFRYKNNVRIGGKRGLFAIINVQRSRACKRCRAELHMKKLAKLRETAKLMTPCIFNKNPDSPGTISPNLTITHAMNSEERSELVSHLPEESNEKQRTEDVLKNYDVHEETTEISEHNNDQRRKSPTSTTNFKQQHLESIVSIEKHSDSKQLH